MTQTVREAGRRVPVASSFATVGGRTHPVRRRIEALLATGLWLLVVLSVQPWTRPSRGPQGLVSNPQSVGKGLLIAGVFGVALVMAMPRLRMRVPAAFLWYTAYMYVAIASAFLLEDPVPTMQRVLRLALAMAVPLLLWRWLGGRPDRMIGAHRLAHCLLALTVLAGAFVAPAELWSRQTSFSEGSRLQGTILPMLPPRVGEVGAIVVGLVVVGLVFRRVSVPLAVAVVPLGTALIFLSRTRTAAGACFLGLCVAFFLTRRSPQARRALVLLGVTMVLVIPLLLSPLRSWALREQNTQQLSSLTGRSHSWVFVLDQPSSIQEVLLGHGLGNKRVLLRRGEGDIDVMAIDDSWLSAYWETGVVGVGLIAGALLAAWVSVLRSRTPYIRASAAFLLTYVTLASITETGLSDLSSLTLHLLVAGVAAYADRRVQHRHPAVPATGVSRS